jgi:hypothetical protein
VFPYFNKYKVIVLLPSIYTRAFFLESSFGLLSGGSECYALLELDGGGRLSLFLFAVVFSLGQFPDICPSSPHLKQPRPSPPSAISFALVGAIARQVPIFPAFEAASFFAASAIKSFFAAIGLVVGHVFSLSIRGWIRTFASHVAFLATSPLLVSPLAVP